MRSTDQKNFHVTLVVSGRVQGVGFRYTARNEANRLGVKGYVKNKPDGSVVLELEGNAAQLNAMIGWCKAGPPMARVENVKEWSGEVVGYDEFHIR
jgi:acylphosphatase